MWVRVKLFGGWNTMSEVGRAMIAVSKNGHHKHQIEVSDISRLANDGTGATGV